MNYTIQSGDTLSTLARRFGTTVQAIAQANGITDPNRIRAGQTLQLPEAPGTNASPGPAQPSGGQTYTVRSGDTLGSIAQRQGTTVADLARINGIADPNRISAGQVLNLAGMPPQPSGVPLPRERPTSPRVASRPGPQATGPGLAAGPSPMGGGMPNPAAPIPGPFSTQSPPPRTTPNYAGMTLAQLQAEAGNVGGMGPDDLMAFHDALTAKRGEIAAAYEANRRSPEMQEAEASRRASGIDMRRPGAAPTPTRSFTGGERSALEQVPPVQGGYPMPQANATMPPGGYPPPPPPNPFSSITGRPGPVPPEMWGTPPPPIPGQMGMGMQEGLPQSMPGQFGLGPTPEVAGRTGMGANDPMLRMLSEMLINGSGATPGNQNLVPALIQLLTSQGVR